MKLTIRNFGPIKDVEYEINEFNVLIGRQASGKSTISKLVYYFLNCRDEIYDLVIELLSSNPKIKLRLIIEKLLRQRFVEFFGPNVQLPDFNVVFEYSENFKIEIFVDPNDLKYLLIRCSESLYGVITEILRLNREKFRQEIGRVKLFKTSKGTGRDIELDKLREQIESKINQHFGFKENLLFIPAGRSLLSTLSDQLQLIEPQAIDFPMRQFIKKVAVTKSFFGLSLEEIIRERSRGANSQSWLNAVEKAQRILEHIIQGRFIHDRDGDKIVIKGGRFVKINFSSSGQQESIWIVLSLFLIILERADVIVFIEEPEAHLFPDAQKEISDFVILVHNTLKSKFVITTHSPYILSAINNNLYAGKLFAMEKDVESIMSRDISLESEKINIGLVEDGYVSGIIDEELKLIDVGMIDGCSRSINEVYQKLEELEFDNA